VPAGAVIGKQLFLAWKLDSHTANSDDVRLGEKRGRLDILVYDLHIPMWRAECGKRGKAERRIDSALPGHDRAQHPPVTPKAFRKSGVNQQQAHVALYPSASVKMGRLLS
jgi:hypothetical protein